MRIQACCLFLTVSLVLPGAGCSNMTVQPMPDGFPRLSTASSFRNVWIEGKLYTNHVEIFGANLLKEGYVPVAVRIFLRGESADDNSRVSVEDIKPNLYLADGTVLEFVPYDLGHFLAGDGTSPGSSKHPVDRFQKAVPPICSVPPAQLAAN